MCNCGCTAIRIPAGAAGATGAAGSNGTNGNNGIHGAVSFRYSYSTTTTGADPGSGFLRLNNANVTSATELYISETEDSGTSVQDALLSFDDSSSTIKAYLQISKEDDNTKFVVYTLTASITDNGTWETWTINHLASSSTTPFSNNDAVVVSLARVGDKGSTGATGATGASGVNGKSIHVSATHTALSGIASPASGDVALIQYNGDFWQYSGGVWTKVYHATWDSFSITSGITTFTGSTGSIDSLTCRYRVVNDIIHMNIQGTVEYNVPTSIVFNLAAGLATGYGLTTSAYGVDAHIQDIDNNTIVPLWALMTTGKDLTLKLHTTYTPGTAFTATGAGDPAILCVNMLIPVVQL